MNIKLKLIKLNRFTNKIYFYSSKTRCFIWT